MLRTAGRGGYPRPHAARDGSITTLPDGRKTGYAATYCRDFFGNAFEIMEIHDDEQIRPVWRAGEGVILPS